MRVLCVYVLAAPLRFAAAAERFRASYLAHDAGVDHDLLVVQKGAHLWAGISAQIVGWSSSQEGYDIGPFQAVCQGSDYDLVILLSSTGRILADGWLERYVSAFRDPEVAAVSATASYAIGHSGREPNPHLRTANIMVRPEVFNDLNLPRAVSKMDCWHIEHADHNLTRLLTEQGYRCLVVGRDGLYDREDWPESRTFWQGDQANLLVTDHQTDRYTDGDRDVRHELELEAWHSAFVR